MKALRKLVETATLSPDLMRALRAGVAFSTPLFVGHALGRGGEALFVATSAQMVAVQDLRGAYPARLGILATITLVVAGAAMLGTLSGNSPATAVVAMGGLALLNGLWRHLSADYGPGLGVASTLLFLLALAQPSQPGEALHLAGLVAGGALWAVLLHILSWLLRGQHPLRYAVAEAWVAASDLALAMRAEIGAPAALLQSTVARREADLRAALDRTFGILGAAESSRNQALVRHLEEMRRQAVHLTVSSTALHAAMEHLPVGQALHGTAGAVLETLGSIARTAALALLMHREKNLAAFELRISRGLNLLSILREEVGSAHIPALHVAAFHSAIDQLTRTLQATRQSLRTTTDREVARAEMPALLPELAGQGARQLAAWMNPEPLWSSALLRHAIRSAVLTMAAVALYLGLHIPHGYWIAFTIVVVLQPDYGATRKRALERVGGTVAGSLAGSALLGIRLPLPALDLLASLNAFLFAWLLRRNYAAAVFFVTLMLILITETMMPVHLDFTITRVISNALGGGLALVAAWLFWPVSERGQQPRTLAAALRANRTFLEAIAARFANPDTPERDVLFPRRHAEKANGLAATSAERLAGEPGVDRPAVERAALGAAYLQRLTRALTVLAGPVGVRLPAAPAGIASPLREVSAVLDRLATGIEADWLLRPDELTTAVCAANRSAEAITGPGADLWREHFGRFTLELRAMILAISGLEVTPGQSSDCPPHP